MEGTQGQNNVLHPTGTDAPYSTYDIQSSSSNRIKPLQLYKPIKSYTNRMRNKRIRKTLGTVILVGAILYAFATGCTPSTTERLGGLEQRVERVDVKSTDHSLYK